MIWGESSEARHFRLFRYNLWFAWHPVKLVTGRWCWWEHIWRARNTYNERWQYSLTRLKTSEERIQEIEAKWFNEDTKQTGDKQVNP